MHYHRGSDPVRGLDAPRARGLPVSLLDVGQFVDESEPLQLVAFALSDEVGTEPHLPEFGDGHIDACVGGAGLGLFARPADLEEAVGGEGMGAIEGLDEPFEQPPEGVAAGEVDGSVSGDLEAEPAVEDDAGADGMLGAEDDAGPDAARGGSELGELGVAELDEEGEGAARMVACERIEEAGIEFVVGALEGLGDGAQAVEGLFAVAFEQEEERVDASDEGVCARLGLVDNSEGPLEDGAGAVEVAAVEPGEPGQSICGGAEVAEAAGIEPLSCERELGLCLLVSLQVDEDLCEGDACEVEVVEVANLGEGEA